MSERDAAVEVADFPDRFEAQLARGYLADHGIPAWIEEIAPSASRLEPGGPAKLLVPVGRADDARMTLAEMPPFELAEVDRPLERRRPLWVPVVGAMIVAGMVATAVPRFLWAPILGVVLVGFLLWRLVRPLDGG